MTTSRTHRASERGEGSWSNIFMLIFSILLAIAAFNAGPIFLKNYELEDKITEISRSFPPGDKGNADALLALENAIEETGMTEILTIDDCSVTSQGTIGGTRTVKCTYTRKVTFLPGVVRPHTFSPSASAPTF